MNKEKTHEILESPEFKELVRKKWMMSFILSALMLSAYIGFILAVAFSKELLATRLSRGLSLGIPFGIGLIALAWILTGIYVRWANNYYDKKIQELIKHIK